MLRVHPGLPGEADRVAREIARVEPGTLLVDLDTESALRLVELKGKGARKFTPSFVDALYQSATHARFAKGMDAELHPLAAAHRSARANKADFIALRAPPREPGIFSRWSLRRDIKGIADSSDPDAFTRAFTARLVKRGALDPASDVKGMAPRLESALDSGRAPYLALMQAPRADAFLAHVRKMPRRSLL